MAVALGLVAVLSARSAAVSAESANDVLNRRNVSIEQSNAQNEQSLCITKIEAEFLSGVIDYARATSGSQELVDSLTHLIAIQVKLDNIEIQCPLRVIPTEPTNPEDQ